MANIFLGIPHYAELAPQALPGLMLATTQHQYRIMMAGGSLLAFMFNKLWCDALNQRHTGLTHFAMHHSDIQAQPGWLDALVSEQQRVGADILSVVIPIKDNRGLTSTGMQDPITQKITRLTVREVLDLPPTFEAGDTKQPFNTLVVNTGLWVCDFTKPWVEEVCFAVLDGIGKDSDGHFRPRCIPEDWNFSKWANDHDLKVFATTAVQATHFGLAGYLNHQPWGEWQTDQGDTY